MVCLQTSGSLLESQQAGHVQPKKHPRCIHHAVCLPNRGGLSSEASGLADAVTGTGLGEGGGVWVSVTGLVWFGLTLGLSTEDSGNNQPLKMPSYTTAEEGRNRQNRAAEGRKAHKRPKTTIRQQHPNLAARYKQAGLGNLEP